MCEVRLSPAPNNASTLRLNLEFNVEPGCKGRAFSPGSNFSFDMDATMTRDAILAMYAQSITAAREGTQVRIAYASSKLVSLTFRGAY